MERLPSPDPPENVYMPCWIPVAGMRIPVFYGYLLLTMGYGAGHCAFHVRRRDDLSNWDKIGCACLGFWAAPVLWPVMLSDDLEGMRKKLIKRD